MRTRKGKSDFDRPGTEATLRRDAKVFCLLAVMRRSTNGRRDFAFAVVVTIPSWRMSERASEERSATRTRFTRPNFLFAL